LSQPTGGAPGASEELFALVYDELRRLAGSYLRRERPDHTLRPTELVHEAYLRLVDAKVCRVENRAQFLGIASRAMRQILVEHARRRGRRKRGGGWKRVTLDDAFHADSDVSATTLLALNMALEKFATNQPDQAHVVDLHFFGGLTHAECAEVMGVSERTVARYWAYAQAWLCREMSEDKPDGGVHGGGRHP
jgi:RNA polymerase sigma factor (TIGR02999 family)